MADTKDISMHFWASQEEYDLILKNMALSGNTNLSAFLRKMAIDGMVIKLDMPEIKELLKVVSLIDKFTDFLKKELTWSQLQGLCCVQRGDQYEENTNRLLFMVKREYRKNCKNAP